MLNASNVKTGRRKLGRINVQLVYLYAFSPVFTSENFNVSDVYCVLTTKTSLA